MIFSPWLLPLKCSVCRDEPRRSRCQDFISFPGWMIFHRVDGPHLLYLGFHLFAVVNNAAVNTHVQIFTWTKVSFLWLYT